MFLPGWWPITNSHCAVEVANVFSSQVHWGSGVADCRHVWLPLVRSSVSINTSWTVTSEPGILKIWNISWTIYHTTKQYYYLSIVIIWHVPSMWFCSIFNLCWNISTVIMIASYDIPSWLKWHSCEHVLCVSNNITK